MAGAEGEFEKLAYEAALRGLDKQERLLEGLRARTGVLLAAASIAAPFLGQRAFQDTNPRGVALIALAGFVASIGASVFVLVPRKQLAFAEAGSGQYETLRHLRDDMAEVYRRLIYATERLWASNDQLIGKMNRAFAIAASALVTEVICFVVILGDGLT
jgi:hypothetical protein